MTSRDYDNLYYVYFGFLSSRERAVELISKYTSEFEEITPIGYNYKEYKIWIKNPGGLMNEIDGYGGYIRKERESGFLDGAPNQGVIDYSVTYGAYHITTNYIKYLHLFKSPFNVFIRQLYGSDAGAAHKIEFVFSDLQKIKHYVSNMYDSDVIRVVNYEGEITDNSDVDDYEIIMDFDSGSIINEVSVMNETNTTSAGNMYDSDDSTHGTMDVAAAATNIALWYVLPPHTTPMRNIYSLLESNGAITTVDIHYYIGGGAPGWVFLETLTVPASGIHCFCEFRDLGLDVLAIRMSNPSVAGLKVYSFCSSA